jgi:signal transduction histidine kinase
MVVTFGSVAENRRSLAMLAGFAVTYFVAVQLGDRVYGALAVPSPFWLPDSILLCALLLASTNRWWIFVLCAWLIRWLAGALPGTPHWFVFVSVANDTLKAVGAAWILRRLLGPRVRLNTLKEFLLFLGVAAAVVPLLSALLAAPARRAAFGDPLWGAASNWFLGDALTQIVITPTILYWWTSRETTKHRGELFIALALLAAASSYAFVVPHESYPLSLIYIPVPILIWAAVRLRPLGAATALTLMAVVSMVGAVRGTGVFAGDATHHSTLTLQLFLFMSAVSTLSLAVLIAERDTLREREAAFNNRLLDAQDHERARIAQELHDDIAQRLALLQISLERFRVAPNLSVSERRQADGLAETSAEISSGIRALSHKLHPSSLRLLGVDRAIKGLCSDFAEQYQMNIRYTSSDVPQNVDAVVNLCLFRIVQEALHNAVKHSGANSAEVELSRAGERLVLSISDSGIGFDVDLGEDKMGFGLSSMHQRLRPLGGNLTIKSTPGTGTRVRVEVPFQVVSGPIVEQAGT